MGKVDRIKGIKYKRVGGMKTTEQDNVRVYGEVRQERAFG